MRNAAQQAHVACPGFDTLCGGGAAGRCGEVGGNGGGGEPSDMAFMSGSGQKRPDLSPNRPDPSPNRPVPSPNRSDPLSP